MEIGWNVDLCCLISTVSTLKVSLMRALNFEACTYYTLALISDLSLLGADQNPCSLEIYRLVQSSLGSLDMLL